MNREEIIRALERVGELPDLEQVKQREELLRLPILERVLRYLQDHPGNLFEAGKSNGLSRDEVLKLKEQYPNRFKEVEDRYYDSLEEDLLTYARDGEVRGKPQFDPSAARMVLERRRSKEWNIPKRVSVDEDGGRMDNSGPSIVDEFLSTLEKRQESRNG